MTPSQYTCDCGDQAPASLWWRIGGGAFLAMNGMVFSIALNGSEAVTKQERFSLELTILCVSLPVFFLLAGDFLAASWRALRQGRMSIEMLFLTGIGASLTSSAMFFLRGSGNGYADVAAMLLVVYSLGRQIGAYGKQRVLRSWAEWSPKNRRARRTGTGEMVPVQEIRQGEAIRVLPGECVPLDCVMSPGARAYVFEASITGEALPVAKQGGDAVRAGSFPVDASIDAVASAPSGVSDIDRIRTLIESGLARPGAEQAMALRAGRWFVPVVLTAMAGTFVWHSRFLPWEQAAFIALSVAVVACPCALGFATPLAIWTGIARLRELGIVARSGEAVEKLAEIDTVVFDKTGTLTLPELYTASWRPAETWRNRENELKMLLREAELASGHVMARSLASLWDGLPEETTTRLKSVRLLPGAGILGTFDDGRELFAGSRNGRLVVEVDGAPAAEIELRETQAVGVADAVLRLRALGVESIVASGDGGERTAMIPVARRLWKQSPSDKYQLMRNLRAEGKKVLFAGDGLNDSAAMAWSHVSCAAPQAAEMVRDLSGLIFLHRDWTRLAPAIALARKTRQVMRRNIAFSLTYNLVGLAFAAAGWLHPIAAALIMTGSSLTVIIYTSHLMDWELEDRR